MSSTTKILRFREKHGDRIFVYGTPIERRLILAQVAQERLDEGYWYDTENGSDQVDLLKPNQHLSDAERIGLLLDRLRNPDKRSPVATAEFYLQAIERWMRARRGYEYEDWREEEVEKCRFKLDTQGEICEIEQEHV